MAVLISIVFLVVMAPAVTGMVEYGPPLCFKNSETNMLQTLFTFKAQPGQVIEVVAGYVYNGNNQRIRVGGCDVNITNTIVGGQTVKYYQIESKIDINNETNTINGCGITKTTVNGSLAYRMIIGIREKDGFVKANDSDFMWFCYKDAAPNTFLTTVLEVRTPNLTQTVQVSYPSVILEVIRKISSTAYAVTTTCNVGEELGLRLTYNRSTPHQDFLTPWGVFTYDTKFGPDLPSVAETITLSNGCIDSNNRLGFTTPFARQASSSQAIGVYEATGGTCKRFGNKDTIVFVTKVAFCSGVYTADGRCNNYCTWSQAQAGRKKRSDDYNPKDFVVELTIVDEETESGSFKPLLIGLTVGVFVILVVVVAVAVYVLCVSRRQRRSSSKSRFSNSSSYASSVSSKPAKY